MNPNPKVNPVVNLALNPEVNMVDASFFIFAFFAFFETFLKKFWVTFFLGDFLWVTFHVCVAVGTGGGVCGHTGGLSCD